MKRTHLFDVLALGALVSWAGPASAAQVAGEGTVERPGPVNSMCPIGKEPIVRSAGTVAHGGHAIGLCCPGCGPAFLGWDETRRDEFVALALRGAEPGRARPQADDPPATQPAVAAGPASFPYPLDTCVVTGEKLGSRGEPVVVSHDGREVRLCCRGCVRKLEANPDEYLAKIDARIVETQLMHYPIETCIVAGGKLGSMGEPVDLVWNNRLVRFCCAGCTPTFKADPAKHLAALDRKVVEQQVKTYPLDTCVVAGAKLGSMGEPVNHVFGNRLVRFCCGGCLAGFEADPSAHMAKIDKAYAEAQRAAYPLDTCVVAGGALGSMGDPFEIVAGTRLVRFCCAGCLPAFQKAPDRYLEKLDAK